MKTLASLLNPNHRLPPFPNLSPFALPLHFSDDPASSLANSAGHARRWQLLKADETTIIFLFNRILPLQRAALVFFHFLRIPANSTSNGGEVKVSFSLGLSFASYASFHVDFSFFLLLFAGLFGPPLQWPFSGEPAAADGGWVSSLVLKLRWGSFLYFLPCSFMFPLFVRGYEFGVCVKGFLVWLISQYGKPELYFGCFEWKFEPLLMFVVV